jgi:hypothetical protein
MTRARYARAAVRCWVGAGGVVASIHGLRIYARLSRCADRYVRLGWTEKGGTPALRRASSTPGESNIRRVDKTSRERETHVTGTGVDSMDIEASSRCGRTPRRRTSVHNVARARHENSCEIVWSARDRESRVTSGTAAGGAPRFAARDNTNRSDDGGDDVRERHILTIAPRHNGVWHPRGIHVGKRPVKPTPVEGVLGRRRAARPRARGAPTGAVRQRRAAEGRPEGKRLILCAGVGVAR